MLPNSAMRPATSRLWLWRIILVASALAAFLYASSSARYSTLDASNQQRKSDSNASSSDTANAATKLSWHARLHEVYLKHSQNYAKAWQQQEISESSSNSASKDLATSANKSAEKQQLRVYDDEDLPEELIGIDEDTLLKDKYSIIVSTFNRVEHLHHFLGRVANGKLPRLDAVFIAWGLGGVDPPEWLDLNAYKVPVHLSRARVNSLTERFVRPKEMRTDAGLWIDDDLQIHPEDIEFGFTVYQQMGRMNHRITGYSGRQTLIDKKANKHSYEIAQPNYSMVLTNSAFMDTQILKWFWNTRDERIRESIKYVDQHMNCEDILMNFVVSDKNGLPPILVEAYDVQQLRTSGISDQPDHYHERSACIIAFKKIWGMPLRTTDLKIVPSKREAHRRTVDLDVPHKKPFTPWAKGRKFVKPLSEQERREKEESDMNLAEPTKKEPATQGNREPLIH